MLEMPIPALPVPYAEPILDMIKATLAPPKPKAGGHGGQYVKADASAFGGGAGGVPVAGGAGGIAAIGGGGLAAIIRGGGAMSSSAVQLAINGW